MSARRSQGAMAMARKKEAARKKKLSSASVAAAAASVAVQAVSKTALLFQRYYLKVVKK